MLLQILHQTLLSPCSLEPDSGVFDIMPTDPPGSGPAVKSSLNPGGLLEELAEDTTDPYKIVNKSPVGRYRLTFLDATCLIINRMIGES